MIDFLMAIEFVHAWVLWFLLLVPAVLVWALLGRRSAVAFSTVDRVSRIRPGWRECLWWLPPVIRSLALVGIIIGAARPQQGIGREKTVTKGVAIMMVLDRSTSMEMANMEYRGETIDRLEGTKRVFRDFVIGNMNEGGALPGRDGDLIGLIGFGRFPETYCPLVRDYEPLVESTKRITAARSNIEGGTAIGDAVALAASRLRSAEQQLSRIGEDGEQEADPDFKIASKVMIVLTDGEEGDSQTPMTAAAAIAKEWGITIYTIDFGTFQQGRMFRRSSTIFESMAEATGGKHFNISDETSLEEVYAEIDALEPTEIERVEFSSYIERFDIFVLIALGLIGLDTLLSWGLLRRAA
ncbi:MAG: VWA domain-containing protein [Phycisphaerales bacterium JB050]